MTSTEANNATDFDQIVTPEEWRTARLSLLETEKAHTREADKLAKLRSELPMVKVDKDYTFTGPDGNVSLSDLFHNRRQLIVYHLMFDPEWDGPCKSCSFLVDQMPQYPQFLNARDTTMVFVSRAPYEKLAEFKKRIGWETEWVSSYDSSFNYDYNVTVDENVKPVEYNFKDKAALEAKGIMQHARGEQPGFSVFLKEGGDIFHSYSCYGRGPDHLLTTYGLLDLTPLGRQDTKEGEGGPEGEGLGFKYHDEY